MTIKKVTYDVYLTSEQSGKLVNLLREISGIDENEGIAGFKVSSEYGYGHKLEVETIKRTK